MTNRTATAALVLAIGLARVGPACADEWDEGSGDDLVATVNNVLFHGSRQVHDLAAHGGQPDVDLYRIASRPFSSYQVVIDGQTGALDLPPGSLQRLDSTGAFAVDTASTDGLGSLTLRWAAGNIASPAAGFVRVQGASCGTQCDAFDRYRVRFEETTLRVPRFNDSGTQSTVLLVQNTTDRSCAIAYHYLRNDGSLIATESFVVEAGVLQVLPPSNSIQGQSGSVRIGHTCGSGGLSGKAVSIEPATGFTFDTPLVPRPR
jgi:hypothetical protein